MNKVNVFCQTIRKRHTHTHTHDIQPNKTIVGMGINQINIDFENELVEFHMEGKVDLDPRVNEPQSFILQCRSIRNELLIL